MNSKERMVTALKNRGEPDRVPVYPGLCTMYPITKAGIPFWDVEYFDRAAKIDLLVDFVKDYGHDGWFSSGFGASPGYPERVSEILEEENGKMVVRDTIRTSLGELTSETVYRDNDSRWLSKGWADGVDIEKNVDLLCCEFVDPWKSNTQEFRTAYDKVGGLGIVELYTLTPFDWWGEYMRHSAQDAMFDFIDYPEIMKELTVRYVAHQLEVVRAGCELLKPDMVQFQGTSSSMSILSPDMFREINLPYIRQAAAICKEYDIPTYFHSGGRSFEIVKMVADTDLSAIGPVECPPTGDNDLAELKRRFGDRLCFQGNVNTITVMKNGTPAMVRTAVRKCIDDAAGGGGYILGTGDQTSADTTEENVRAFIDEAHQYGRYFG